MAQIMSFGEFLHVVAESVGSLLSAHAVKFVPLKDQERALEKALADYNE
jgi:hypothetical protein